MARSGAPAPGSLALASGGGGSTACAMATLRPGEREWRWRGRADAVAAQLSWSCGGRGGTMPSGGAAATLCRRRILRGRERAGAGPMGGAPAGGRWRQRGGRRWWRLLLLLMTVDGGGEASWMVPELALVHATSGETATWKASGGTSSSSVPWHFVGPSWWLCSEDVRLVTAVRSVLVLRLEARTTRRQCGGWAT
uniref:Uncharacterized protein n=1 Tax=Leersia perrieri TaxID=77586 RepID=A0A0D9WXV0_9ORYZ